MKNSKTSSKPNQKKKTQKKSKVSNLSSINMVFPDDKFKIVNASSDRRGITKHDVDLVLDDRAKRMADYITSILEPEFAVTEGFVARQPGLFQIPSTSVSFRNNVNISTDEDGDFALAWNPNFFTNVKTLESSFYFEASANYFADTYSHVTVKNTDDGKLYAVPSYVPDVDLSKYRLVSAKIKVTYIGSVLNKSGMMYACATFDQTPILVGYKGDTDGLVPIRALNGTEINWSTYQATGEYDRLIKQTYANMNEQSISNGIWNKSLNVTNSNQGMSCLHIPTDPVNEIFYPVCTYFGNPIPNTSAVTSGAFSGRMFFKSLRSTSGAQLCYYICGHGLPPGTECINIQTYYTYEVIPTQLSAPFLRTPKDTLSTGERKAVEDIVKGVHGGIAISNKPTRSIWSSVKNYFKNVDWGNVAETGIKLVPQILKWFA